MAIASVPTSEPASFYAGDSITWKISNSDYKASAGWTLKYDLRKSGVSVLTLTSTASGDDHLISVSAATTAGYTAGEYEWRSYVTSGSEKYTISTGLLEILANTTSAGSTYDWRSTAKKVIDALETALEGTASASDLTIISQSCGDLSITRKSDIYDELQKWKSIYETEKSKLEVSQGRGSKRNAVYMRFVNP